MSGERICSVLGCSKPARARGLCVMHYQRQRLFGTVELRGSVEPRPRRRQPSCAIADCDRRAFCRGWCSLHYQRWSRHGDAEWQPPTLEERFLAKINKDEANGCWLWTAAQNGRGYGTFGKEAAHRWAYEHYVGPIPDGLCLDHLCRVPLCVNPLHLEPVTILENFRRGVSGTQRYKEAMARRTHCSNGHPRVPENLDIRGKCRVCDRERHHRDYWRARL